MTLNTPSLFSGADFDILCETVSACDKCNRMHDSQRVLNRSAGNLKADLMFIGEAPGRRGADASGIPFHGDQAGHNFEKLMTQVGLNREDIFVTNAVLCNPKNEKGNNAPPKNVEIKNCIGFLKSQIDIVDPKIVVTLGGIALRSTALAEFHELNLKENVRSSHKWFGRMLIPAYHPGQRAMIHRSFANQLSDYQFIAEHFQRIGSRKRKPKGKLKSDLHQIVNLITQKLPSLSYFKLHKLLYLIEYKASQELGHRLTETFIVRQKDGPYCVELHIKKLKETFSNLIVTKSNGKLVLCRKSTGLFDGLNNPISQMTNETVSLIESVLSQYAELNDAQLKDRVYMTGPMRWMLKGEKKGVNYFNAPIDFTKKSNSPLS